MSRNRGAVSGETNTRRRWAFRLTILVVLTAAFVTSFKAGSHGAYLFGFPPEFLFTAPLICDIVAGLATLVHGWARDDAPMRSLATKFVLVPMGLSWVANAADHLDRARPDATWPVVGQVAWVGAVIVFAGLCPVAVASLLFFSTRFGEFERREAVPADVSRSETAEVVLTSEALARPDLSDSSADGEPEFVEPAPVFTARRVDIPAAPAVEPPGPVADTPPSEEVVDELTPPRRLTAVSTAASPWGPRARELKSRGVPHASAYRQAKREWREENEVSA